MGMILVGMLLAGAHFFKAEIIAKVLEQVNKKVDVPIAVSQVDFSLIHDFPNASVLFEEVFIADRFDETDTLLYSSLLTLEFDMWDMVNGRYTIDKVGLGEGRLKMRTMADGQVNYIFWKKSEESDPNMTFAIDRLELSDIDFSYSDTQANLFISSNVGQAKMKGKFSEGWMNMVVGLEGTDTDIVLEGKHYLQGNDIAFESKMLVDELGHQLHFENCIAEVGKVKTPLTGRIFKEGEWNLDLTLDGSLEIVEFLKELPSDQKGNLDRYHPKGKVDFLLTIKGESSTLIHPKVDLAFDMRSGEVQVSGPASAIRKIRAKGRYTRNEKGVDKVHFAHFDGNVPQGRIAYVGLISDFDHPYVMGQFTCDADFSDLMALSQQDVMSSMRGNVKVDLDVRGHLPTKKFDISSKNRLALSGEAQLEKLSFELTGNGYVCSDINSTLVLKDDRLIFDTLMVTVNDDPLTVSGHLDGLWPFVLGDGHMAMESEVYAEEIHWDVWAQAAMNDAGGATALNHDIAIETSFEIGAFTYSAFKAENVSGHFGLKNGQIGITPIHFNSCSGTLDAQIQIAQREDLHWASTCDAVVKGVDIGQLFTQFDQFGQVFLTSEYLEGNGDARIHFDGVFDPTMTLDLKTLRTDADLRITDGELNKHPAMQDIVEGLRENNLLKPFVRTDELEYELSHIRFNTLENKIKIANEVIHIPEMRIASNAMEIAIAGTHAFSNRIDYSVQFNLRDILINTENPEFYIEDDGLGHKIRIRMYGTADNPKIELDKEKTKENRKEALAQAKQDIREFFSDPFRSKDFDNGVDSRSVVKVSLEEDNSKKETPPVGKSKTTKKKRLKALEISKEEDTNSDDDDDF